VHGLVPETGARRLVSEQGTREGHPSFVHIRLRAEGGPATDIGVGGRVVPVLEGRLSLDEA
jgi:predicted PhzF superfamily epimerase YddE/YHI9